MITIPKSKDPLKVEPVPALAAKAPKDRSPSFPFIPLQAAIERLEAFEKYFGRHPAPASKVGLAWGMKEKSSQGDQTLAALRSFGLLKYEGMGAERLVSLTEEGRGYIRAQQETVKKGLLKQCALRPKIIRHFWALWGADRPPDPVALDSLHDGKFSDAGAVNFLKVYDDTIAYAGLSDSDKVPLENEAEEPSVDHIPGLNMGAVNAIKGMLAKKPSAFAGGGGQGQARKENLMAGERELTTGLLSKDASFRLVVTGTVGVKEIERLIKKLELDKEILADQDEEKEEYEK